MTSDTNATLTGGRGALPRRVLLAAPALLLARTLHADAAWPSRPVRVIAPTAAGSGSDNFFRLLTDSMGETLGQPVVVENKAGAGGVIGNEAVARAAPDGYTIGVLLGSHVMNRYVLRSLPYDPVEDFTPIIHIASTTHMLVAHPNAPFKTALEMAEMARRQPGKITIGGSEPLSLYGGQLFAHLTKTEITSVPYRGGAAMTTDVIAGTISAAFTTSVSSMPHVQAGRLRALGVSSPQRSSLMPDIPSLNEAGIKGFAYGGYFGLMGPAGLPDTAVQRIAEATRKAVLAPNLQPRLAAMGVEVNLLDAGRTMELLRQDDAKWAEAARQGLLQKPS
jgi:tripartite-type tricarboxylate transporter receptor subunit TctC